MIQLTDKIWTMDVPSMSFGLMVNNYGNESELIYMLSMSDIADDDNAEETLIAKPLPPGAWRFLFTTKTATEEDARKVVEKDNRGYKYYWDDKGFVPRGFNSRYKTALESLHSLLRSKGLDDRNYALIEKLSSDE